MRLTMILPSVVLAAAVSAAYVAKADDWNEKTAMTFAAPVELPGRVLPPGTYIFKLIDSSDSAGNIVAVYNKNESHVYGIFLTVPDYRLRPSGKTIVTFAETPAGSPDALWAWFYPGDNYGHEFVYPKSEAVRLAKANNRPVAAMPDEVANQPATNINDSGVSAMKRAHVTAVMPNGQEVEPSTVFGSSGQ